VSATAVALAIGSLVSRLPIVGDALEAADAVVRAYLFEPTGWLENAIVEAIGSVVGYNEVNPVYGLPFSDIFKTLIGLVHAAAHVQAMLGIDAVRTLLGSVFNEAFAVSVGTVVRTIIEAGLRSRGVTHLPWAFDLLWLGQIIEYIDPNALALIAMLSGSHPIMLAAYLGQGLPWLYDMEVRELYEHLRRSLDDYNSTMLMDIEAVRRDAELWLSEGFRVYHRTVNRLMHIVDHIIERSLARIWELRLALYTTYRWYEAGLVDEKRVVKAWEKLDAELEMAYSNALYALNLIKEELETIDYRTDIEELLDSMENLQKTLGSFYLKSASAIYSYDGFRKAMENVDTALYKALVAKYRFDVDKAIKPSIKYWDTVSAPTPGSFEVEAFETELASA